MNPQRIQDAPFFIVGCERSGTTLLQILLDAHPRIAIPPESHLFFRFSRIFDSYGDLLETQNLHQFVGDLLKDDWVRAWGLNIDVLEFCNGLFSRTIAACIDRLFELFATSEGKLRWGEKTPSHVHYVVEIQSMFPNAKFIHIVRDGRDVARSMRNLWFGPTSIYQLAHQ